MIFAVQPYPWGMISFIFIVMIPGRIVLLWRVSGIGLPVVAQPGLSFTKSISISLPPHGAVSEPSIVGRTLPGSGACPVKYLTDIILPFLDLFKVYFCR